MMIQRLKLSVLLCLFGGLVMVMTGCGDAKNEASANDDGPSSKEIIEGEHGDLSSTEYHVTQENGTEKPFNNAYWDNDKDGIYVDIISGEPLFSTEDQYNDGSGWPSFTKPIDNDQIEKNADNSLPVERTEVRSEDGDAHLGHVFDDGPEAEGGKRYCINSASLRFIPKEDLAEEGFEAYESLFTDEES